VAAGMAFLEPAITNSRKIIFFAPVFNNRHFMYRIKILLAVFCALSFNHATAQTQDLISLAQGDYLGMNALFDEQENLFGYIALYNYGKSGEKTKKFEYVLLDKNLNPFANKTFDGDKTAGDYHGYINFDGKIILKPSRLDMGHTDKKEGFTPSSMVIDLKTNTVKKKVYYDFDHGTFKEILQNDTWENYRKEYKAEKKENGFNYSSYVSEIKEGGFLVSEYDDYGSYEKNNHIFRYDEDKKLVWRYDYNADGSKASSQLLYMLTKNEKYYYGLMHQKIKREADKFYLLVLDMKTGKEVHRKQILDEEKVLFDIMGFQTASYGNLHNIKNFDDKIVLVGRKGNIFINTGFSRLVIDKNTFETDLSVITYDKDFRTHVPNINYRGYVERGYFLDPRDIFFMKDGSVGLLFEKYKAASEYTAQKTSDLVYVYTDKNFKVTGAKTFEKEKSKWQNADYLFSQNINNGNDLVFFYRDYQKDDETKNKNWNLFINTLIDGKFNQEMIPISSKKNFFIFPYVAKEGYILLQEFNTKEKYNQIRLERLNY
jgi:hypothetical protein